MLLSTASPMIGCNSRRCDSVGHRGNKEAALKLRRPCLCLTNLKFFGNPTRYSIRNTVPCKIGS